jgi:hypothetical protein
MKSDKESLDNFHAYWDLVNAIDALYDGYIEKGNLFGDDVISALDRVKTRWTEEHIKCAMCNEEEENNTEDNDIPDKI